jgi:hypothetical protein
VNRLLTALGIDYAQWKALTIASLKLDLRVGSFGGARTVRSASGRRAIIGQAIFYGMLGIVVAIMVWTMVDRFVAGTLLYSYVIVMVGTAMLVDHNTAITSPTDYGILGHRPVTSRTYFASKLTNALVYTLAMTTALGVLPVIAFFLKHGLLIGAAATLALYACAGAVTLTIVAAYSWLMQRVGARRLRNVLSYMQMFTGLLVYGGFFLTMEGVGRQMLASFTVERTGWLLLLPATWFTSWVEVAAGSTLGLDVAAVIGSIVVLAWLGTRLRGRLSLEYSERLGVLASETTAASPSAARPRPGWWFRSGEARAAAILIRGHFRNDLKFRMGVLAVVPVTLIYLAMGLRESAVDTAARSGGGNFSMVSVAVIIFPMLLKQHLAHSDSFRASWVFFSSPADRTGLIRSAKNVLLAFFLMPYLVLLGAVLAFLTRDYLYVAIYLLLLGSLSHIALLVLTLIQPELPFAKPVQKGGSTRIIGAMAVIAFIGSLMPFIVEVVEDSPVATVVTFATIVLSTLTLDRLTRLRIERQTDFLEFEG